MPIYEFECACGHNADFIKKMGDFVQICPKCGQNMNKLISTANINVGPVSITGYYDDNLQTYIRSNTHREQVMREQGVTEFGATPKLQD
ncbi:MAG: zinc ribbon domain-containing protein [Deltaproteobacteria bacterium]|nr:zinc ribbon domain-containing protein [Deltaproteobacteria bacterium]